MDSTYYSFRRAFIYMYPFNVINWFKMVLLSGTMSICLGAIYLGIRWRYWDSSWPSDPIFEQVRYRQHFTKSPGKNELN